MMAQQTRTEVIANNIANVNTTAFKRSRAHFVDLLYQTVQGAAAVGGADAQTTPAVQVGRGTRLSGIQRMHSQGSDEQTNRPLDLTIEGEGFFQVQLPGGLAEIAHGGQLVPDQDLRLIQIGRHQYGQGQQVRAQSLNRRRLKQRRAARRDHDRIDHQRQAVTPTAQLSHHADDRG